MNDLQKCLVQTVFGGEQSTPTSESANGERTLCVLDRGFIFVGSLYGNDRDGWTLKDCSNVRRWGKGGFGGLTKSAAESETELDTCADIQFSDRALVFRARVTW